MLQNYFGETPDTRCGNCDYCRARNKLELNHIEFNKLCDKIKNVLEGNDLSVQLLVTKLHIAQSNKGLRVVRWLVDQGKLVYTSGDKVSWNSKRFDEEMNKELAGSEND